MAYNPGRKVVQLHQDPLVEECFVIVLKLQVYLKIPSLVVFCNLSSGCLVFSFFIFPSHVSDHLRALGL
jgi:hypothetical protein